MSSKIDAYEKLGAFYLGREVDPQAGTIAEAPLLYDSKDLTTHAVVLGMTGCGKTGLGIALLEEAAIDGIPSIVIDPKGDLGNLLLTFPQLSAGDFRPWVDEAQAARCGQNAEEYAAAQAELWSKGLAKWDQDGERVGRLREAVDIAIYTPGSEAGLPISILTSFQAPPPEILDDGDLLRERISTTASSLLSLLGIDADPVRSREAILLANLLDRAWSQGQDLDLASLIAQIQDPPFDKVGVLPLDSFYPAKERFELSMAVNNLLASPTFQGWLEGEALDVDRLLYTAEGKPRVAILSIAHLSDSERMFFVSLLLGQVTGWMRSRSGTSCLRALLYMDEIYGYLPPVGNPPSKKPLLTLLKQARAFGLGLVLATQNPVDLDYKALSNIGTWMLGRLQTERDQQRVMDGLLAAEAGLERKDLERLLAGLEKRRFLLHNVHEDGPVLFDVRWVLSYLRGPLTRRQIETLMEGREPEAPPAEPSAAASGSASATRASAAKVSAAKVSAGPVLARPVLDSDVPQRFVESRGGGELIYRPALVGAARVHFVDRHKGLEAEEEVVFEVGVDNGDWDDLDWHEAREMQLLDDDFEKEPEEGIGFADLPSAAAEPKNYKAWSKDFADMLYRQRRWELWKSPAFGLISEPGESERDFRIRLREHAREERDRQVEKVRDTYGRRLETNENRVRRAEQKVEKEAQQARDHKLQTMVKVGTTLLGALMGRKTFSRTNLNKASSAFRGVGRSAKESQDVELAEENLEALLDQRRELEAELEAEVESIRQDYEGRAEQLEVFELAPRRTDINISWVALTWLPHQNHPNQAKPAW